MPEASESVSFKKYGVKQVCGGCGRHVTGTEIRWFRGWPLPRLVFGYCCWAKAAL